MGLMTASSAVPFQRPLNSSISAMLQNFRRDGDVLNLVGTDIHLYPFSPDYYPKAVISVYTHLYPMASTRSESRGLGL